MSLIWGGYIPTLGRVKAFKLKIIMTCSRKFSLSSAPASTGLDRTGWKICPAWLDSLLRHTVCHSRTARVMLAELLRLPSVYQLSRSKVCRHCVEQQ